MALSQPCSLPAAFGFLLLSIPSSAVTGSWIGGVLSRSLVAGCDGYTWEGCQQHRSSVQNRNPGKAPSGFVITCCAPNTCSLYWVCSPPATHSPGLSSIFLQKHPCAVYSQGTAISCYLDLLHYSPQI